MGACSRLGPCCALSVFACLLAMSASGARAQTAALDSAEATDAKTAEPEPKPVEPAVDKAQAWVIQAQSTLVDQGTFRFRSPYDGANSLNPGTRGRETVDATLYGGLRLWRGAQVWINPEIDQGFGLSDTLGVAGFPSGEAYKVGKQAPYIRLQRFFLRQTVDLGGEAQAVDADQNVLSSTTTTNRLVFTAGEFGVGDVFDTNKYAHDPRGDFLNWSLIDAGSFDYAANSWGYTYGVAGEWYQGPWVARLGLFDMSKDPNGERPDDTFTEFQVVPELERDFSLLGQAGKLKLTGFISRARMGDFADAIRLAEATDAVPDVLLVRRYHSHAGLNFNLEQQLSDDLGVFARGGWADGHQQAYEFTDIDKTLSGGASLSGKRWGRPDDTVGLAGVVNDISRDFKTYLNDGGLGILIGDGRLPDAGAEKILETYYSLAAAKFAHISFDYQFVENPAYNRDRGPVSIIAIRLHLQSNALFAR